MNLIQLQPDDVLVLCTPGRMDRAQRDASLAGLRSYLGPDRKVIFLDAGETLDVLRGAQTAPEATGAEDGTCPPAADDQRTGGVLVDPGAIDDVTPPHVWMYRNMLTALQLASNLGRDGANGQYAVAVDQLTDEQRVIPHVSWQLSGADVLSVAVGAPAEENEIVRKPRRSIRDQP